MREVSDDEIARRAGVPDDVLARAFRASNGELARQRQDAIAVAELLERAGVAILGGEVWLVGTIRGRPHWTTFMPFAGGGEAVFTWNTEPDGRQPGETWDAFCARGARQAVRAMRSLDPESEIIPELRPRIRYNICYVGREEYEARWPR